MDEIAAPVHGACEIARTQQVAWDRLDVVETRAALGPYIRWV
jgi:hypothetical protein